MNILIKSELGDDKRRFRLKECSFSCLCYNLSSLYQLSNDSIYSIVYLDNENEWITLASTNDLKEAYSISTLPFIRIRINIVTNSNQSSNNSNNINFNNIGSSTGTASNNVINIAQELLSNPIITQSMNQVLSSTLMNYLPMIIKNTVPYTIPILVSSISTYQNNNNDSNRQQFSSTDEEQHLKSHNSHHNVKISLNKSSSMIPQTEPIPTKNNVISSSSPNLSFKKLSPSASFEPLDITSSPINNSSSHNTNNIPLLSSKRQSPIHFFFKSNTANTDTHTENNIIPSSNTSSSSSTSFFRPISPPPSTNSQNPNLSSSSASTPLNGSINGTNTSPGGSITPTQTDEPAKRKSSSSFRFPFFSSILNKSTKDNSLVNSQNTVTTSANSNNSSCASSIEDLQNEINQQVVPSTPLAEDDSTNSSTLPETESIVNTLQNPIICDQPVN